MLKHEFATMNGRQTVSSTIRSSYTSLGTVSDLSQQKNITHPIINHQSTAINLESLYANNIKELSILQRSLKEQNIMDLPNTFKSHQQHNHTIGYLALSLSLITLLIILSRRKTCRREPHTSMPINEAEENIELQSIGPEIDNTTPTPLPRHQVHRYILHV